MKTIKIMLFSLLIAGTSSCDDFLSELPDNRTQLDTPEKISELLVNAYPERDYMGFAETMSDNVFESGEVQSTTLTNTQNYNWQMVELISLDTPAAYWDACYSAIAHANQALDAIKKLNNDPKLNPQRGEALLCRAYAHFMLVTFWAQRYDPATAQTALGIPYVLEPEEVLIKKYTRNTVAEVYNYIQQDLEEGLKYVTDNYETPSIARFHFNKAAANAFASRFYLMKGDWQKVLAFSEGLGNRPTNLRDYGSSYSNLDFNTRRIVYAEASLPTNILVGSPLSIHGRNVRNNRFSFPGVISPEFFGPNAHLFNKTWIYRDYLVSTNGQIIQFITKFPEYFRITNANSGIGVPYTGVVLFSNDEFFLHRIEAHVMTGQLELANEELTYFLSLRTVGYAATDRVTTPLVTTKYPNANEYDPFYALTDVQKSYIKAIAEIRRREFLHEGIRWFDIKRFALEVTHKTLNQPDNVLTKNDLRRVLQIPLNASNNGIEKNPR